EQRDAERRDRRAHGVLATRPIVEEHRGEADREEHLQLNDERREPGRHPELHAQEQKAELADADREAVSENVAHRHSRRLDEKRERHGGEDEAYRGERERRDLIQANFDRDERKSPQRDDSK